MLFPGAELAIGGLGMIYVHSIDLTIRSLGTYNVKEEGTLERIFDQIDKLPSTYLRHQPLCPNSSKDL